MKLHITNTEANFFIYLKKQIRLISWLPNSLDIPPNLEFILGNWYLASNKQAKYLESNLVCVSVVSLPVSKQHDIVYEIFERMGQTYKIKIVAATFINMNRWKWMLLATWSNIYTSSSSLSSCNTCKPILGKIF